MASSLSTIVAKDGTPTTIAGGLLAVDKSGAGTGPFFGAHAIVDTQGTNTVTVKAASTAIAATDTPMAVGLHPTSPLPAGTNVLGHVIVDSGTVTTVSAVTAITNALPAGTNVLGHVINDAGAAIIGKVGIDQTTDGTTNAVHLTAGTNVIGKVGINDGTSALVLSAASTGAPAATVVALPVTIRDMLAPGSAVSASSAPVVIASDQAAVAVKAAAATTGGSSNARVFSVTGTPTATAMKTGAGTLLGYQFVNTGAAPVYLKIYNTVAGSVTVGTTTPAYTIPIPTVATTGSGIAPALPPCGIAFSTAMSWALTNVAADNDATAVAVGVTGNIQFA